MTNKIILQLLQDMDKEMRKQNRHILLFLDNCAAHGCYKMMQKALQNIKLAFFPPNCTSHLQPLDQGIIQSLKVRYRSHLLRQMVSQMSIDGQIPVVNILQAINIVSSVWHNSMTATCIQNCFRKAGFRHAEDTDVIVDTNDDDGLSADLEVFRPHFETFLQLTNCENAPDIRDYALVDDDVVSTVQLSDSEIIEAIADAAGDAEESDDESHVEEAPILFNDAVKYLANVRKFLHQCKDVGVDTFNAISCVERDMISKRVMQQKNRIWLC